MQQENVVLGLQQLRHQKFSYKLRSADHQDLFRLLVVGGQVFL
jgi:hypothetical protein